MKVFAARYCSCTHESGMSVLSLHKNRETAESVVIAHRSKKKVEHRQIGDKRWQKRFPWTDEHGSGSEAWDVCEYDVLE